MDRQRKKLSRARRVSRILVWSVFLTVVLARYVVFRDHFDAAARQQGRFDQERRRRPSADLRPPVSQVPPDLWRIQIEIDKRDVEILRGYFWNGRRGGSPAERPEVMATVREGGVAYTNVALHLKGAAGSFRPFDDKPALTLNFSKRASGQRFHGFSKISLNNSVQDPSFLCEAISRELFVAAGVPAPQAGHATVIVNGRDLGLYVFTEGYGKTFLKRHFTNVKGNLYDGGFVQEVTDRLRVNSGDQPEDRSGLDRLIAASLEENLTNRWDRLSKALDVERFITLLALEVMTCHWDGYAINRNNYRLFHDLETDRMIFMPHGMDQMFGTHRFPVDGPIQLPMNGMVARAVGAIPQVRRLYLDRIASLRTNLFTEQRLTNRVHELSQRIRPTLAAYHPSLASQHDHEVASLCYRISERARSISEQLALPNDPIEFDEKGSAELSNWSPHGPTELRGISRYQKIEADERTLLHITAGSGTGGSWRTRALLESGRYRFEGRAKVRDAGTGACLRVAGARPQAIATAEDGWVPLQFIFFVEQMLSDVEFVCELRGSTGEAWFDLDSLRLVRE